MTDNEIIKALECCSTARTADDCEKLGCPSFADPQTCIFSESQMQGVIDGSLDLINRQKAEIERLNEVVERIQHHCRQLCILEAKQVNNIRAEAIKEFAERLKAKKAIHFCKCGEPFVYTDLFNGEVDNLVKEMVGNNNG